MKEIQTREGFLDWLDEQEGLHDAFVESIEPLPSDGSTPETAHLLLRLQTSGSCRAGERRHMRELNLVATGVARFDLPAGGFLKGHCSQGAEIPDDASLPVSMTIDVPMDLRLDCEKLQVSEREWEETVPEYFSDREFTTVAKASLLPSPEEWIAALDGYALNVVWRMYGGQATSAATVPRDYEGWFLQQADRVDDTAGGVFFFAAKRQSSGFRITLERHTADDRVWASCARYLGSFPDAEVVCGNVKLSGAAWLARIASI